jgi:hypothetical protein
MITIEIVQKLMALALNNPSEEEARSAALQAIKLIDRHQIPVGDKTVEKSEVWTPPSEDFMKTVNDILNPKKTGAGNTYGGDSIFDNSESFSQQTPGTVSRFKDEPELEDFQSAIRKQTIRAWRAIREARKELAAEIARYEKETRRKFRNDGHWNLW